MIGRLAALLLLIANGVQPAPAPGPGPRLSLPIQEVRLKDGTLRYAVALTVDGVAVLAGLDTGSTGLRVREAALPSGAVPMFVRSESYKFSNGSTMSGPIVLLPVVLGPGATRPIALQVINQAGCETDLPHCSMAAGVATSRLMGDGPGEGFQAILGLGLEADGTPNPLLALGVRRWIVDLPQPGTGHPGALILNPSRDDLAGFSTVPFTHARGSGMHDAVSGCLKNDGSGETLCGSVALDTGAPGMIAVRGKDDPARGSWPAGTGVTLSLLAPARPPLPMSVIADADGASHLIVAHGLDVTTPVILAGTVPYFGFDVLYDADVAGLGFRPRDDFAPPP